MIFGSSRVSGKGLAVVLAAAAPASLAAAAPASLAAAALASLAASALAASALASLAASEEPIWPVEPVASAESMPLNPVAYSRGVSGVDAIEPGGIFI